MGQRLGGEDQEIHKEVASNTLQVVQYDQWTRNIT